MFTLSPRKDFHCVTQGLIIPSCTERRKHRGVKGKSLAGSAFIYVSKRLKTNVSILPEDVTEFRANRPKEIEKAWR